MNVLDKQIESLKVQADKLKRLLDDPQPGLLCWLGFVAQCRTEINAIMDGKRDEQPDVRVHPPHKTKELKTSIFGIFQHHDGCWQAMCNRCYNKTNVFLTVNALHYYLREHNWHWSGDRCLCPAHADTNDPPPKDVVEDISALSPPNNGLWPSGVPLPSAQKKES